MRAVDRVDHHERQLRLGGGIQQSIRSGQSQTDDSDGTGGTLLRDPCMRDCTLSADRAIGGEAGQQVEMILGRRGEYALKDVQDVWRRGDVERDRDRAAPIARRRRRRPVIEFGHCGEYALPGLR
jgi:hypothetical protein